MMDVVKEDELIELYEEWAEEDDRFEYAAKYLKGEVGMSQAQKQFIAVYGSKKRTQQEVADYLGISRTVLSEYLRFKKKEVNFKPLTEKLRTI